MTVLAVGLSHKSAPSSVIERAHLDSDDVNKVLHELIGSDVVTEAVVLSTCTRVEVYVDATTFHGGVDQISDLLSRISGMTIAELQPHLYLHHEARAVQHLFEVTCGLDSVLVGEAQIQGQIRDALRAAQDEGAAGRVLGELFGHALRTGRRARSETGIDEAARSLVAAGLREAATHLGGLSGRRAVIVGAGATGSLAAKVLAREGIGPVVVANRTAERGARLAALLPEATLIGLDGLTEALADADLIVCSTAGPAPLIHSEMLPGTSVVVLDLAMPRDVDQEVGELDFVTLIDLESLTAGLTDEPAGAEVAATAAVVDEEVTAFASWQHARVVAPTVTALREQAARVVAEELRRLGGRLPELDDAARAEVAQTVQRVVDKLLHAPTVRVKELSASPGGEHYAQTLRELFGLDREAITAVSSPVARP